MDIQTTNPLLLCLGLSGLLAGGQTAPSDNESSGFLAILNQMLESKGFPEMSLEKLQGTSSDGKNDSQQAEQLAGLLLLSPYLLTIVRNEVGQCVQGSTIQADQALGDETDQNGVGDPLLSLLGQAITRAESGNEKSTLKTGEVLPRAGNDTTMPLAAAPLSVSVEELAALLAQAGQVLAQPADQAGQGFAQPGDQAEQPVTQEGARQPRSDTIALNLQLIHAQGRDLPKTQEKVQVETPLRDMAETAAQTKDEGGDSRLLTKTDQPFWLLQRMMPAGGTLKDGGVQESRRSGTEHPAVTLTDEKGITVVSIKEVKAVDTAGSEEARKGQSGSEREIDLLLKRDMSSAVSHEDSVKANGYEVKESSSVDRGQFAQAVTERIDKIVEQYARRDPSADMTVRLRIDDKGMLFVGLKEEGQKIMVELRSPNQGLMSLLQTNKESIVRTLEQKNVYTTISVDPIDREDSSGRQKREERRDPQQQGQKESKEDAWPFKM